MKQVQGSAVWLLLAALDLVILLPELARIISHFQKGSVVPEGIWVTTLCMLAALTVLLEGWLFPTWSYGDMGIETCAYLGNPVKQYGWDQVVHIEVWNGKMRQGDYGRRRSIPGVYEILMKDGVSVFMSVIFTKDFSRVIGDIVPRVLRGNPEAYVAPQAMRYIQKESGEGLRP